MKKIFISLLLLSNISFIFAANIQVSNDKMANPELFPPIVSDKIDYKVDEKIVKKLLNQKNVLLKINCDKIKVLKQMGFVDPLSKIFSIGVEDNDFDFTFDLKTCSVWGNKRNYVGSNNTITIEQALLNAEKFMKVSSIKNKVFGQFGKAMVISKNKNGGPYPLYKTESDSNILSGIDIDYNDTGDIKPEYTSFSIVFPYMINGVKIYNQYGSPAGITLEISADGVTSVNAQLLHFKGAMRSSEKMTEDGLIQYIKNGGHNPFWGQAKEVVFDKPEKIFMLFSIMKNNVSEMFIGSAIRLGSKIKVDQRQQNDYEMIISDYKIGNPNIGY